MNLLLVGLFLLAVHPVLAQDKVSLRNDREGKSFYQSSYALRVEKRAMNGLSSKDIVSSFVLLVSKTEESKLCSFDLNKQLKAHLKKLNPKFNDLEGVLYHLRFRHEIDDLTLKILLRADKVEKTRLKLPKYLENLTLPYDNAKVSEMVKHIAAFKEKLGESCLDEAYRNLYGEMLKIDKKVKDYHLEALYVEAHRLKLIDLKTYMSLEKSRVNGLEKVGVDLKSHYRKVKSIRTHSPLRDSSEKSDFVTDKFDKKISRRQRLLEQYSDLQILLMGKVIKKLRERLESDRIEILVYARDEVDEIIPLEPMERFRFAIKVLRKEMGHLALNSYFKGSSPDYMDLMTAAYETGIIPALEMEEIAGLQEIWNPKKTFWDKANVWIKTFSSVATIAIPPPFGFIPALALVVIEFTTGSKKNNDDNTSLF